MTTWHDTRRAAVNAFGSLFGVRVVNADWGPRGVFDTLRRAKSRGFAPALIFDIGASNGQWTRECLNTFSRSRYVLVDPLESNCGTLMAMAAADDRITAWSGAAGAAPGRTEIFDHGDQSSILPSAEYSGPARTVDVGTVDQLFEAQGSPAPVLLKADVQGYELEVLRGASLCLKSAEMLILEVSFRKLYRDGALAHEIIAYVGDRGFRIYDVCSYLQRPMDSELVQSDIVFVHESSSLFSYQGWGKSS
jgi:FkbM family methyltransferase